MTQQTTARTAGHFPRAERISASDSRLRTGREEESGFDREYVEVIIFASDSERERGLADAVVERLNGFREAELRKALHDAAEQLDAIAKRADLSRDVSPEKGRAFQLIMDRACNAREKARAALAKSGAL